MFQALTKIGQKHGLGEVIAVGPWVTCPVIVVPPPSCAPSPPPEGPHDPVGGTAWGRGGGHPGNVGGGRGQAEVGSV